VAHSLAAIAGLTYIVMGAIHGGFTLRDVFDPKSFTPTDPRVREAMRSAQLAFNPRANIWRAWLGFNLSHSVGLLVFGGLVLALGWRHSEVFAASPLVQVFTLLVAASYVVLSVRFWFWARRSRVAWPSSACWSRRSSADGTVTSPGARMGYRVALGKAADDWR
jgi:hypothetical protein